MNKISKFTVRGKEIDLMYNNGFLAYSFEHNGSAYGCKLKIPSKSVIDIASTTFLLMQNAWDSIEAFESMPPVGEMEITTLTG